MSSTTSRVLSHSQPPVHSALCLSANRSHDLIVERMQAMPRGRVLDVPAGSGALAARLAASGFDAQCADIDRGLFTHDELMWHHCDLNEPLPFSSASFDYVVCVAGLHRVHYPEAVIAEFGKVLKPGGILLVAMWNHGSIRRRLRFLTTGSVAGTLDSPTFQQTVEHAAAHFRQILTLPRLIQATESGGFDINRVEPCGHIGFRLDYLLWLPLIWVTSLLHSRQTRRKTRCAISSRPTMLLSPSYLLMARKRSGGL